MSKEIIRVLITDDHQVIRKGIRILLSQFDDIDLVGEASDGWEAVELFNKLRPDVVLMDLVMPRLDGIEATRLITTECPEARILMLTSFIYDDHLFPAIKAGVQGCILKEADPKDLVHSIRQVYHDQPSIHPKIARKILLEDPTQHELTEREIEVITLVAKGLDGKQIADQLSLTGGTISTHIRDILEKIHLSNRAQPAFFSLSKEIGFIEVGQK